VTRKLIPLTDPAAMLANGLPFRTTDAARWHFRHRVERGTAGAFVRDGSRVLVDPDEFHRLIRLQNAGADAA
jgi:hypothetical protein